MKRNSYFKKFISAGMSYALVLAMMTSSISFPSNAAQEASVSVEEGECEDNAAISSQSAIVDENGETVGVMSTMEEVVQQEELESIAGSGARVESNAGDDIHWVLYYDDGSLIITGTGKMWENESWRGYDDVIKTVKIESGVEDISSYAFYGVKSLESIEIADTVTEIGDYAFQGCTALKNIVLPNSIKKIGRSAFEESGISIIQWSENLEELGENIFCNCEDLKTIDIPTSISEIPCGAFSGSALEAITIPQNIEKIGERAFRSTQITTLYIPENVSEVEYAAFAWCEKLESVSMADSDMQLGNCVFSSCSNLKNIHLSGELKEIPEEMFGGCSSLEVVQIPNKVEKISSGAFVECKGLKEIFIPSNVKEIEAEAFRGCSNIKYQVSEDNPVYNDANGSSVIIMTAEKSLQFGSAQSIIPQGILKIDKSAFIECDGLTDVVVPEGVTYIGERAFWYSSIKTIDLPDSVTFIGSEALSCCDNLEEVVLPDNIKTLEFCLFSCDDNLKKVVLPKNCVYIDEYVFGSGLAEIEIPMNVRNIEERAFDECSGLSRIINNSTTSLNLKNIDKNAIWVNETDRSTPITYIKNGTAIKVTELETSLNLELVDGTNFIYTGEAIKPAVVVTCKGLTLVEGKDYTLKYTNNVNATIQGKEPTISVVGKGNYAGNYSAKFDILPADMKDVTVANTTVVSGSKPALSLMYRGKKLTAADYICAELENKITKDTNYELVGKGNYTGSLNVDVKIVEKSSLQKLNVTLETVKFVYNGERQLAEVKVVDGKSKTVLTENVDYVIVYPGNCTDVGTKTITVSGVGLYTGSVTKKYTIEPTTTGVVDASALQEKKYIYNGTGVTVSGDIVIKDAESGVQLKENVDYKISYSGNTKIGTAKCTVKFQGNYKKSAPVTVAYQIVNGILSDETKGLGVYALDLAYNGKPMACKTNVYVELNGVLLKNSDYMVSYFRDEAMTDEIAGKNNLVSLEKNEERKTIYVKVKGKGKYANADENVYATGQFKLVSPSTYRMNLSKAKVSLVDEEGNKLKSVAYTGNAVNPGVKVEYTNGKKVTTVDPSMYTVTYLNNVNKGKATILINGNGYHTVGGVTTTFTIGSLSLKDLTTAIINVFKK